MNAVAHPSFFGGLEFSFSVAVSFYCFVPACFFRIQTHQVTGPASSLAIGRPASLRANLI
jgi:hypothetical protein